MHVSILRTCGHLQFWVFVSGFLHYPTSSSNFTWFVPFRYCPLISLCEQSDGGCWGGSFPWEVWWKLSSIRSTCQRSNPRLRNSLMCVPFISQGLGTNEAEITIVFFCEVLLMVLGIIGHHRWVYISITVWSSMPSKLAKFLSRQPPKFPVCSVSINYKLKLYLQWLC